LEADDVRAVNSPFQARPTVKKELVVERKGRPRAVLAFFILFVELLDSALWSEKKLTGPIGDCIIILKAVEENRQLIRNLVARAYCCLDGLS